MKLLVRNTNIAIKTESDYINEINEDKGFSSIQFMNMKQVEGTEKISPNIKVKMQIAFVFNNDINILEYYHNSSF